MIHLGERNYVKNESFPDSSITDAQNYCRSPEHEGYDPWCFTTNPSFQWEYCGVQKCEGITIKFWKIQTSEKSQLLSSPICLSES